MPHRVVAHTNKLFPRSMRECQSSGCIVKQKCQVNINCTPTFSALIMMVSTGGKLVELSNKLSQLQ